MTVNYGEVVRSSSKMSVEEIARRAVPQIAVFGVGGAGCKTWSHG